MNDLVLLHGWGVSSDVFGTLRRALAPSFHVQAIDLPGYRDRARVEPYTLDALARCIADAAPRRCAVLGWSLGALVALTWAAEAPAQVTQLIVVAGTPCFVQGPDWRFGIASDVFYAFARELESDRERTLRRFVALQARGDENSKAVTRALGAASVDASNAVLERGLRILSEADLRPIVGGIQQPTLVIHGARDELVPVGAAEYLTAHLRDARRETLSGAAHAPFLSEPDRVAKRIADFLQ
jgi:pimeloyl-[acyl-carrier protein] methyl ester esterase